MLSHIARPRIHLSFTPRYRWFSQSPIARMFIQVESTPNENALKFKPGVPVLVPSRDSGQMAVEFTQFSDTIRSPLARSLFSIQGVKGVFFGSDFITVNKQEDLGWALMKPEIFATIMDYYSAADASTKPLIFPAANETEGNETENDSEVVQMVKELLDTRIRPAVNDDGGDIEFVGFDEQKGIVKLRLKGSCRGCSSSTVTLKSGIENMLKHYIPEVKLVEQVLDEAEQESVKAFQKLEEKLNQSDK